MTLNELLRTEIWSKETTRKILFGCGAIILALFAWAAVEHCSERWLSPAERTAGRAALAQIDALQNFDSASGQSEVKLAKAQRALDAAEKAAWTERDKGVATVLMAYLSMTEVDASFMVTRRSFQQRYPDLARKNGEFENESAASGEKVRIFLRQESHRILD